MAGGMSWTVNWLQFDNAYFKRPYQNADKSKSKRSTSSSRVSGEEGSRAAGKKRTGSLSSAGSSTQSHSFPLGSYTQSSTSRSVAALESPHVRIEGPDTGAAVGEGLRKMGAGVGTGTGPLAVTAAGEGQTEGQWEGSVGDTSCSDSNSNCSTSSHPSKRSNMLSQPSPSFSSSELLWLPTDEALFKAPEFRFYFEQYAADQCLFFSDYCLAHRKMSELGALFDPPGGIEF